MNLSSRYTALKFKARHLIIISFYQVEDNLIIDNYDSKLDGERPDIKRPVFKSTTENRQGEKTSYTISFVLSLLALDPALSYPIYRSFLYEYRDPTFDILYS